MNIIKKSFLAAVAFFLVSNVAQADQYADFLNKVKSFDSMLIEEERLLISLDGLPDGLEILSVEYGYCPTLNKFFLPVEMSYPNPCCYSDIVHSSKTFQEWLRTYKNLPEGIMNAFRDKKFFE